MGQTLRKDNGCDNTLAIYLNYVSMAPLIARKQYGVQRMDIGNGQHPKYNLKLRRLSLLCLQYTALPACLYNCRQSRRGEVG